MLMNLDEKMKHLNEIKRKKLNVFSIVIGIFALSTVAFAAENYTVGGSNDRWSKTLAGSGSGDSFSKLRLDLQNKISGNLGKLFALVGFVGTFIAYLTTHKGSVLFTGAVISIVAGGLVGIIGMFFNAGTSGWQKSTPSLGI